LSRSEFSRAKTICEEARLSVLERAEYLRQHAIDPRFALPDANWSYDAPNEFVQLFRRICDADEHTLNHFRGLSQVFSGHNLYNVCNGKGMTASDMPLPDTLDDEIRDRLEARNHSYVNEWQEMTRGLPRRFIFAPPRFLGEVGHDVGGVIVNDDTCTYQERVNLIYASGLGEWIDQRIEATGNVRICEIGGGYGALCSWFKQAYPEASYTIVDLPESLLFSRLYVSLARPDLSTTAGLDPAPHGVRFVPNYMAENLPDSFDLIINTLSMSEMSEYQVNRYLALMKTTWLRGGGLFFEQNTDNRHMGFLCAEQLIREEFPEHLSLAVEGYNLRHGSPNVWSMQPIGLTRKPFSTNGQSSVELLEDLGDFNLVRCTSYWGLHKNLGPTDPLSLAFKEKAPWIFSGRSPAEIRDKTETWSMTGCGSPERWRDERRGSGP
jgi:hypothetical protein